MKKLLFIITTIIISFNICDAGSGLYKYKNCWWGNVRYTTWANLTCDVPWPFCPMDRSCRLCNNMCLSEVRTHDWVQGSGCRASAWLGSGGPGGRIVEKRQNWCHVGKRNNYKLLSPNVRAFRPPSSVYEIYANDTFSNIIFDSITRTITIKDYYAILRLQNDDLSNVFISLSIKGIYNNLQDTFVDNDSIFKTINIYLQGNAIVYNGISSDRFSELNNSENLFEYTFNGGDIVIDVPENINFEFVGISMDTECDEIGLSRQQTGVENTNKDIYEIRNIFPSPTRDLLNLNIYSKIKSKSSIKIIDLTGKIVYQEKNIRFAKGINLLEIDAVFLKPGRYTLMIENGHKNFNFRFIKE